MLDGAPNYRNRTEHYNLGVVQKKILQSEIQLVQQKFKIYVYFRLNKLQEIGQVQYLLCDT